MNITSPFFSNLTVTDTQGVLSNSTGITPNMTTSAIFARSRSVPEFTATKDISEGQRRVQRQSRHLQLAVEHSPHLSLKRLVTIQMAQQNDGPGVVENITLFTPIPTTNTANYMLLSGISPGVDHGGVIQSPVFMTAKLTTDTRTQTTDSSILDKYQ